MKHIIFEKTVPKRDAKYLDYPEILLPEIQEYLKQKGINHLYSHQVEMFGKASIGKNVVITTSTASGKTLSFLLPVLQKILSNPLIRALFIYPTKALAHDQYRAFRPYIDHFGKERISIGIYDGDTPNNERSRIRNSANIILTNPDMLNISFLPGHEKYFSNFFQNLRFVVVDELHIYRGAFGSHFSNLFRRLHRICDYNNCQPQFFCSSATIANPVELAGKICGEAFVLVDQDGSPSPEKKYSLLQPPTIKGIDCKKSITKIASELIPGLIEQKKHFLAFCKSRKSVEIVLKESKERLKADNPYVKGKSDLIAGYRGGYKAEERQEIERKMISGQLSGLISTNALELGIDIGQVDMTLLIGYPGTRASFWQQAGRSGRSDADGHTIMILDDLPFDQYIAIDPKWLFENSSENAVIDQNNIYIQMAHVRAAAYERPLSLGDISYFPNLDEIIPFLLDVGELKERNGKYFWCKLGSFPARDFSLRNMNDFQYKVINNITNTLIASLDETQVFREAHKGAIYMHGGQSYIVEKLDLENRIATTKPTDVNYYTMPIIVSEITIIKEQQFKSIGRINCHFGDVNVATLISAFKQIQFHNHSVLGLNEIDPPLRKDYDTEGAWIDLPDIVTHVYKKYSPKTAGCLNQYWWKSYFDAFGFALQNAANMVTMTTSSDISAACIGNMRNSNGIMSICIYDMYIGGLGYAEKAFCLFETIIANAIKIVSSCQCKDGCSACIGDYHLDKKLVLWGLESILKELPIPAEIKNKLEIEETIEGKPFSFDELTVKWKEIQKYITESGGEFSKFVNYINAIDVNANTILLTVNSEFYKNWFMERNNYMQIKNVFEEFIDVPYGFSVEVLCKKTYESGIRDKIKKRYQDLTVK